MFVIALLSIILIALISRGKMMKEIPPQLDEI